VVGNGLSMERIPICGANGGLLMVIDVSNEFIERFPYQKISSSLL
jgi:hypothetical protein